MIVEVRYENRMKRARAYICTAIHGLDQLGTRLSLERLTTIFEIHKRGQLSLARVHLDFESYHFVNNEDDSTVATYRTFLGTRSAFLQCRRVVLAGEHGRENLVGSFQIERAGQDPENELMSIFLYSQSRLSE